jgi:hypothetical protein
MKRSAVSQTVLWLWVLAVTFLMGGGIFEHTVLTPLWAGSPPESVTQWQYGAVQGKFFRVVSPLCYLLSLLLIILCWRMPPSQRNWSLAAAISSILIGIATFSFFIPILQKTQATRGAGLSGDEITALVNQFTTWNWARWIVIVAGWIAGLRALSLRSSEESS